MSNYRRGWARWLFGWCAQVHFFMGFVYRCKRVLFVRNKINQNGMKKGCFRQEAAFLLRHVA